TQGLIPIGRAWIQVFSCSLPLDISARKKIIESKRLPLVFMIVTIGQTRETQGVNSRCPYTEWYFIRIRARDDIF
ncbi:MAG: hypothetical protein PHG65_07705, partial [Kiritimatiellae bacterium]|nr:hypothetical protein [Kiritimatiellia bacterium]